MCQNEPEKSVSIFAENNSMENGYFQYSIVGLFWDWRGVITPAQQAINPFNSPGKRKQSASLLDFTLDPFFQRNS